MAKKQLIPTKELTEKIANAVRAGNYVETAASIAGIHRDTLHEWLRRGARASRGEPANAEDVKFIPFADTIQKAHAESEAIAVAQIVRASNEGQWQAAAWRLERKYPDRWGRRANVDLRVTGALASIQLSEEDEQHYREAIASFFNED